MAACMVDLHIWSMRNQTIIPDKDIGCYTYHEKRETGTEAQHGYTEEKLHYTESRDITWALKNKRPEKLRDSLKEMEDLFDGCCVVHAKWLSRKNLQLMLNNGAVVTCLVNTYTGDVTKITVDRSLVGKLSGDSPSDMLLHETYLAVTYSDKPKLDYVFFGKKVPLTESGRKISALDFKINQIDLPVWGGRRLDRRLSTNLHDNQLLVWWPSGSEDAHPWTPMTTERERANIVLFNVSGPRLDVICYARTECDPFTVNFSMVHPQQIHTIEYSAGPGQDRNTESSTYEMLRGKIQRVAVTNVPFRNMIACGSWSLSEEKLVLCSSDGTVLMYDEIQKTSQLTNVPFTPSIVSWHPSGTLFIISSHRAEIQVYDVGLSPLVVQMMSEDPIPKPLLEIAAYFRSPPSVSHIEWSPLVEQTDFISECMDIASLAFDRGPVCLLSFHLGVTSQGHLTPLLLVNHYIKSRNIPKALSLLCALNWNMDGTTSFGCLSAIVNHLLRQPLNADRENHLEIALGTFYTPVCPLKDTVVVEFREHMSNLARRFFHHLLRFCRFEKAYLLAVDIGARDLFMDIHYLAQDKGEHALAEVAKQKADQIETESLTDSEVDGEEEYSDDDYWDSASDNGPVDDPPARLPKRGVAKVIARRVVPPPEPREIPHNLYPADPRFVPRQHNPASYTEHQYGHTEPQQTEPCLSPEAALEHLEEELAREMMDEYTASLLGDLPARQPASANAAAGHRAVDETSSSVKVIHFGRV